MDLCESYPLDPYVPPAWAAGLDNLPKYKVKLAMSNTPIHKWKVPGIPQDFEVSIKRDDMTGCALSGNKVRKLEFLLADAKHRGCDAVITCGTLRSNHCRATAVAARQMGLDVHLMARTNAAPEEVSGLFQGNTLINRLMGCHFYLLPMEASYKKDVYPQMKELAEDLRKTSGVKAYTIPVGGSNHVGLFGYFDCFRELVQQGVQERFTDIAMAVGSGGSMAGLVIANYLTGSKLRIHALPVSSMICQFHDDVNQHLIDLGLGSKVKSEELVCIAEDPIGLDADTSTPEELATIDLIGRTTGILLDQAYTGKATHHLLRLLNQDPGRFQGKKILFIHTGGAFNLFSENMNSLFDSKSLAENNVCDWRTLNNNKIFDQ